MSIIESINLKNYLRHIKYEVKQVFKSDIDDLQYIDIKKLDKIISFLKDKVKQVYFVERKLGKEIGSEKANLATNNLKTALENIVIKLENIKTTISDNDVDNFKIQLKELIDFLDKNSILTGKEKGVVAMILSTIIAFISMVIVLPIVHHIIKKKNKHKHKHEY